MTNEFDNGKNTMNVRKEKIEPKECRMNKIDLIVLIGLIEIFEIDKLIRNKQKMK